LPRPVLGKTGRAALAGAAAVIVAVAITLAAGPHGRLAGLSLDTLFWLRDAAFGPRHAPGSGPVVVIAIDEATYRTPPFKDTPRDLWSPEIAKTLRGVLAAEPAVIGFDTIFPTSVQKIVPDFETPFLLALREAAASNRIVLGKVQVEAPILPYAGQIMAVRGGDNIRSTNLPEDDDGIVRRGVLNFRIAGTGDTTQLEPSFALELARRAAGVAVTSDASGVSFGDYRVPGSRDNDFLLDFDGGEPPATLSFADVHACVEGGDTASLREQLRGKVVLIGTVLDIEDRKLTSRRLINRGEGARSVRCGAAAPASGRAEIRRASLPGVYIQATAIDNLLRREALRPPAPAERIGLVAGIAALAVFAAFASRLRWAIVAWVALAGMTVAGATAAFRMGAALPMLEAIAAAFLAVALTVFYRYAVADRDKRHIRSVFNLYAAPVLVDRLVAAGTMPELRGERRELTFLFSDIADFTTLTERSDPLALAPLLNLYFDGVNQAIFAQGGFLVEFVGDGVQAIFGALVEMPDHAARAIACARALDRFAERFRAEHRDHGMEFGHTRIGIHTGFAVEGNFGSSGRFKYAALGDTVNTTSRIEGLNKFFGTRIAISEATRLAAGERDTRPLGRFMLKGKKSVLEICELLPAGGGESEAVQAYRAAYDDLLADRPEAAGRFAELHAAYPEDGCVTFYAKRLAAGETSATIVMAEK
jgi:adenylate cyclase